jgi:hypothetical protein
MFDPMSMMVLGGGALVGGGLGLAGGLIQGNAAEKAAAAQLGYLDLARSGVQQAQQQQMALLNPYMSYGSSALSFLQSRVLNSNERKMADVQRRSAMEAEIARLSAPTDWASFPSLTGPKASERKAAMWQDMEFKRTQQLQQAQRQLQAFDIEQHKLEPLRAEQERILAEKEGRINTALQRVTDVKAINVPSSLSQLRAEMQNDEVYKFRQAEGERAINRAAAARGQYFSGAALGSLSDFNLKLSGEETDKYFNRALASETARYQSELGSAQAALSAEMGLEQQGVNNLYNLSNMGLQSATTGANVLGTNAQTMANIYSQQGQAEAAGIQGKAAGLAQGLNSVGQAVGAGTSMFALSQFMQPRPSTTQTDFSSASPVTSFNAPGGQSFLVNAPR